MYAFLYIAMISILTILLMCPIFYHIWYNKNFVTKEQTSKHDKGWNKCYDCKKVENTMYYTNHFFGRIYRCNSCTFKKNKQHKNTL